MPLNSEQGRNVIIERAKQLVNQLIQYRQHDKPPFLPEEFASLLGIKKIVKANLGELSAILLKFHNGCVIKVNEKHSLVRQNFSCAHEIGHTLFDELKLDCCLSNIEYRTFNPQAVRRNRGNAREHLCDVAATELLMPEDIFRRYLLDFGISVNSIEKLADTFRVSIDTVAIRIAEVSPKPCVVLLWCPRQTDKCAPFRLSWSISAKGRGYYKPKDPDIRYPSTLHRAYQSDDTVKCHKLFKAHNSIQKLQMESKGFGYGKNRRVISLAFVNS